jgi:hypothetical protein
VSECIAENDDTSVNIIGIVVMQGPTLVIRAAAGK